MKKVSVVILEKTRLESLRALRKAGVLHIVQDTGSSLVPEDTVREARLLESALAALSEVKPSGHPEALDRQAARLEAENIMSIVDDIKSFTTMRDGYRADLERLEPWGDFDPNELKILALKGIEIRLVSLSPEDWEAVKNDPDVEAVGLHRSRTRVLAALVYRNGVPENAPEGVKLPDHGPAELTELIGECEAHIKECKSSLARKSSGKGIIESALAAVNQDIEFEKIRTSLAGEGSLTWLGGFLPERDVEVLRSLAAEQAWALIVSDPSPDEAVPTLVRNRPIPRLVKPVFDFLGIVPGYREYDISLWFTIFLSVFVAMIIGDAGYGAVMFIGALVLGLIMKRLSDFVRLVVVASLFTVAWGAVTGNWFGSLALVQGTVLERLVLPPLASYQMELFPNYPGLKIPFFLNADASPAVLDGRTLVMALCFALGTLHLAIARLRALIGRLPKLNALAQLGWLSIVLGLFWWLMLVVLNLAPLEFIRRVSLIMIFSGLGVVFVFTNQGAGVSFFRGVLKSFTDILSLVLDAVGVFADIMSYIRLFAVGLAGFSIARSFNDLAPEGSLGALLFSVLILLAGHGLNFLMSLLSVLVHGVRLNVLEFSKHLSMEWSGFGYNPFRLRTDSRKPV